MLVVLPFENLGGTDDEYFADGITEEITTSLARLSGLGVISRTSAIQYKDTDKSLREIGDELKVDCVLEGTIRWDHSGDVSRVRISPQLIRVADDLHLWADRYDAVLDDIFRVQSEIAREVATALDVTLLQTEEAALDRVFDLDPLAYDYFLRGKQHFSIASYRPHGIHIAKDMHLKAIEMAPRFAPAYAELANIYIDIVWDNVDSSRMMLDSAKELIDAALELAPDSPEPYQALGWYYYHGLREFDSAVSVFSELLKREPNNSLAIASIAWVNRRQGNWEAALAGMERAVRLAPRNPAYYYELGITYGNCRQYDDAITALNKAIELEPGNAWAFVVKSWTLVNARGDLEAASQTVSDGLRFNPGSKVLKFTDAFYDVCAGEYEDAIRKATGPNDLYFWIPDQAIDYYFLKGGTFLLMNRREQAIPLLDKARIVMDGLIAARPGNAVCLSYLGKIHAALGNRDKAIALGLQGVEMLPVSVDALDGPDRIWDLAAIYCFTGDYDQAVEQLDILLQLPDHVSTHYLRIAPEFAPMQDHPQFIDLLEKHESRI
jgi:TolB-like protein/Tfp pilus assembly protein PilF